MARPRIDKPRLKEKRGRPLRVHWRSAEREEKSFSTGTRDRSKAEGILRKAQALFELGDDPSKADPSHKEVAQEEASIDWERFRELYNERFRSNRLRPSTIADARSALNLTERILRPRSLNDVASTSALERLKEALLNGEANEKYGGRPRAESTVRSILGAVLAALRWAQQKEFIDRVPHVDRPKALAGYSGKGRALYGEELDRFFAMIPVIVGEAASESWVLLIEGLVRSGLRISELLDLHWTEPGRIRPIKDGNTWYLSIPGDRHKGGQDDERGIVPPFVELLESVPRSKRTGFVFNPQSLNTKHNRRPKTQRPKPDWVSRVISRIGKKAGVKVDHESGKTASAHDLRRTFGQRLVDQGIPLEQAADALGHRDQRTTKRFYVRPNAVRQTQDLSGYFEKAPISGTETETLTENEESRNDVSRYGSKYTPLDSNQQPSVP